MALVPKGKKTTYDCYKKKHMIFFWCADIQVVTVILKSIKSHKNGLGTKNSGTIHQNLKKFKKKISSAR